MLGMRSRRSNVGIGPCRFRSHGSTRRNIRSVNYIMNATGTAWISFKNGLGNGSGLKKEFSHSFALRGTQNRQRIKCPGVIVFGKPLSKGLRDGHVRVVPLFLIAFAVQRLDRSQITPFPFGRSRGQSLVWRGSQSL